MSATTGQLGCELVGSKKMKKEHLPVVGEWPRVSDARQFTGAVLLTAH